MRVLLVLLFLLLIFVLGCNLWVVWSTQGHLRGPEQIGEERPVALVLGTARYVVKPYENPYFRHRMQTAARLQLEGRVKHLLLSGDNRRKSYNEPVEMQKALLDLGVEPSAMTLDYAGFRTLDSVVRCKEVFGQQRFVIVSQAFHNHRAVFIARYFGLDVLACNAPAPDSLSWRLRLREWLARCKAVLDLYVLGTKPHFLGEKIDIPINNKKDE